MYRSKCLILLILIAFVTGCTGKGTLQVQIPRYVVAADVRSDTVKNLTPEIEKALLDNYLSDKKVSRSPNDFKKVVNSEAISGGTVFLARTKGGFSAYFLQDTNNKVLFVSGFESESETNTVGGIGMSTIRDQIKDFSKVFIGTFNFAEATQVRIAWKDGHQTTHQLTNGTLLMEVKENEKSMTNWEVFDNTGKSLYKQDVIY
jgi:hypothetical protein